MVATAPGSLASGNMVDNRYRITTETAQMVLADVYLTKMSEDFHCRPITTPMPPLRRVRLSTAGPSRFTRGAEAIARSEGVTAEAVDYLTQVRARAYWTTDAETIRTELAALSVDDFVEQVWLERNRELIFDVKIWFDMIRTRQYSEGADGGATFVDFIGASSSFGPTFEEKHLLLPIADSEIQRNSELVQNPGY